MARQQTNRRQAKQTGLGIVADSTALYIRVSTERQADEGFSLAAQQDRLLAYCAAQGWHVNADHIYVDAGVTGKTDDRKQFQAMLDAARAGDVKRIVAIKLDRVARNVRNFLTLVDDLKQMACDLVLVRESFDTSTPSGKFALTMFAAMAELEASTITERVMSGKQQKASAGGYNGSACPLGYQYVNGAFSVDPGTAGTVERVFSEFCNGRSMAHIAQGLNADSIPTKTGGSWYTSTVKYILTNGLYAGIAQWDGVETTGTHPAIISREVYEAAHNRLSALRPGRVAG